MDPEETGAGQINRPEQSSFWTPTTGYGRDQALLRARTLANIDSKTEFSR
jgi:hypothetical protein